MKKTRYMKINILEKLTLSGKSNWAKVIAISPIILVGIIMGIWGIIGSSDPNVAEKGLEWTFGTLSVLPVCYFFIFFKWFKI
jgi:hypothetical protein